MHHRNHDGGRAGVDTEAGANDCLCGVRDADAPDTMHRTTNRHLHKVALEEFLQLLLLCRVGQVADVESPALGGAREDGSIGLVVGLGNAGIGQSVGNVIDGGVGGLLHVGSRHFDGCWGWLDGSRLVKSESLMTSKLVNLFLVQKRSKFGELKA